MSQKEQKTEATIKEPDSPSETAPEVSQIDAPLTGDLPAQSGQNVKDLIGERQPEEPKRGRGRPAGAGKSSAAKAKKGGVSAKMSAQGVVALQDKINAIVSAGEHIPDEKERKEYVALWTQYFEENPGREMPVWMVLTASAVQYSAPAFTSEPAKGGFRTIFTKLAEKYGAWRARRAVKK